MDTKISPDFWGDDAIEAVDPEIKLAALWLLTNGRIKPFGYAETNERRFGFETGLPNEAYGRALEALPKTFRRLPKGYFVPNFIRRQFGSGQKLVRNNMGEAIVRQLVALNDPEVTSLVIECYPELEELIQEALPKPSASPSGAQERRGEEKSGAERRGGGGAGGGRRKADPMVLTDQPFAVFGQRLAKMMGRRPSTPWQTREVEALMGLHRAGWADQEEDLGALETYYAAKIASEADFRRRDLATLLNNFGGEVDRARKFAAEERRRRNPDGLSEA